MNAHTPASELSESPSAKRDWYLRMAASARTFAAQMPSAEIREAYTRLADGWDFLAETNNRTWNSH
jgi:hypothetical protein